MSEFAGNPMGAQENPIITACEGELFVPEETVWKSERKRRMWIAIDVAVAAAFFLIAVLLAI